MASQFIDLTSRSVSVTNASVTSLSWFRAADGTVSAPAFSFTADTNTGLYRSGTDSLVVAAGGGPAFRVDGNNNVVVVDQDFSFGFSSGTDATSAPDTILRRDAANTLALRNGTTAQTFWVYNTYTSGSVYERGGIQWASNILHIGTEHTGASARALAFKTDGSRRWNVSTAGHFLAEADNTYDIGASGATRPRVGYFGTGVKAPNYLEVGAAGALLWDTRSVLRSSADSAITLLNNAETAFASLYFGPAAAATSSHRIQKKVTGIADNTATDVFTVTVPNANHAAAIKITLLSSNGSTDAFESSRVATGTVVLARTTGANVVAAVSTLEAAQIATVAAGATHTLAYGVSAISGAVGATNTFTIQVTIDDSGNLGSNQVVAVAELVNAEATGVTIA